MQNGVSKYTKATVELFFDPEHVSCAFCHLLDTEKRYFCRRTGELIIDAKSQIGTFCPLKFETGEEAL